MRQCLRASGSWSAFLQGDVLSLRAAFVWANAINQNHPGLVVTGRRASDGIMRTHRPSQYGSRALRAKKRGTRDFPKGGGDRKAIWTPHFKLDGRDLDSRGGADRLCPARHTKHEGN